jgi:hypothetical protein
MFNTVKHALASDTRLANDSPAMVCFGSARGYWPALCATQIPDLSADGGSHLVPGSLHCCSVGPSVAARRGDANQLGIGDHSRHPWFVCLGFVALNGRYSSWDQCHQRLAIPRAHDLYSDTHFFFHVSSHNHIRGAQGPILRRASSASTVPAQSRQSLQIRPRTGSQKSIKGRAAFRDSCLTD